MYFSETFKLLLSAIDRLMSSILSDYGKKKNKLKVRNQFVFKCVILQHLKYTFGFDELTIRICSQVFPVYIISLHHRTQKLLLLVDHCCYHDFVGLQFYRETTAVCHLKLKGQNPQLKSQSPLLQVKIFNSIQFYVTKYILIVCCYLFPIFHTFKIDNKYMVPFRSNDQILYKK